MPDYEIKQYNSVCEDCGEETFVADTFCPLREEIDHEKVEVRLCEACYQTRREDV